MYIHMHLDDTRIKNRVEYDSYTDRLVGFVLPLLDGLPVCDAFVLQTFEGIKDAFNNSTVAKYAHCIVIKPIFCAPSFVLSVLGTDSKYDHAVITKRWQHIDKELLKRGVRVVSNGSDGAGPFLKAMVAETKLFTVSKNSNVPTSWKFYLMPEFKKKGLCSQDHVHLLAKLRTRALEPSNITVFGAESCLVRLQEIQQRSTWFDATDDQQQGQTKLFQYCCSCWRQRQGMSGGSVAHHSPERYNYIFGFNEKDTRCSFRKGHKSS